MPLKYILCPVTGNASDAAALAAALKAAGDFGGHVRALFVRPRVSAAIPYLGEGLTSIAMDEIIRTATNAADHACARAKKAVEATGAGQALLSLREVEGFVADEIAAAGRLADLVVFALDAGADPFPEQTAAEATLLHARRPILLAPRQPMKSLASKVVILWDGSIAASQAVIAAMPFIERAQAVEIIHRAAAGTGTDQVSDLTDALTIRRVAHTTRILGPAKARDGEALAEAVRASEADLVVMGGYAHSRIRQLVLGGVTRHMLTLGDTAVLMAH